MGKIALPVSREEMLYQAHNILQEKPYTIQEMRVIKTEDSVVEARDSIAGGASVIITRGLQASLIKQYTDIPMVEIVMTAQETALLIIKTKQIIRKPRSVITVVGFQNTFCDMSYFEELYDVELRRYYAKHDGGLSEAARKVVEEDADLLIGGDAVMKAATEAGRPSLFLPIAEDSLKSTSSMAERVGYVMSVEKKSAAQMGTLLDYSYNGVIRLDASGLITIVNLLMAGMMGQQEQTPDETEEQEHGLTNRSIQSMFPDMGNEAVKQVFQEGWEYSLFMQVNRSSTFAILAPVLVESRMDGGILTCHKMRKRQPAPDDEGKKQRGMGTIPLAQLGDMLQASKAMQECIRLARLFVLSEKPIVIMGEPRTEKLVMAQSIHNSSLRSGGPFLDVPCEGLTDEEQRALLSGGEEAAMQVNGDSLLIQDAGCLTDADQYRLYQLIRYHLCHGADVAQIKKLDVWVMITANTPLEQLLAKKRIHRDLYYLLSGMTPIILPLRERPEGLRQKLKNCLKEGCERYTCYHAMTQGAWAVLLTYPWPGSLFQIENFCKRLIPAADRRGIDEIIVTKYLRDLYPKITQQTIRPVFSGCKITTAVADEHQMSGGAREICQALRHYDGGHQKAAEALGINKATLWKKMKRYGIEFR